MEKTNLIINLDSFLSTWWSKEYGNRVFKYDVFISHNRGDHFSKKLALDLRAQHVNVWYDDDLDLNDRRVQEAVATSLINSRFVLVCIDDNFRNSMWCRAEYLPSLQAEEMAKSKRVLVARMVLHSVIPGDLAESPSYGCYELVDLVRLANDLISGNSLPFEVRFQNEELSKELPFDDLQNMSKVFLQIFKNKTDLKSMTMRFIARLINDWDNRHPQQLMMSRQMLTEQSDLSIYEEDEIDFLISATLLFCSRSDSDDRANGLEMLLHLASINSSQFLYEKLFLLFEREPDSALLNIGFPWFKQHWDSLNKEQKSIVEFCALRSPQHIRLYYPSSCMLKDFSAGIRIKIFVRGLEKNVLSRSERMKLIEERTDYLLMSDRLFTLRSNLDVLRVQMGIVDLEIVFRDLNELLFDRFGRPVNEAQDLSAEVISLMEKIILHSWQNEGMPLVGMEEYILDYVLKPLLWFITLDDTRDSAKKAYLSICDLLESKSSIKHEVPAYRKYFEIASSGIVFDGLNSKCFQEASIELMKSNDSPYS